MKDRKVVAVIPAKAHSRRIPNKNYRALPDGSTLVSRACKSALDSGVCDMVIVSTDSPSIKSIAEASGARSMQRPKALLGDDVPAWAVTANVGEILLGGELAHLEPAEVILVQLLPTSPFRHGAQVNSAVEMYSQEPGRCVVSTTGRNGRKAVNRIGEHRGVLGACGDLESNGAVQIGSLEQLAVGLGFLFRPFTVMTMEMPSGLDIDTPHDWWVAEQVIRNQGSEFEFKL